MVAFWRLLPRSRKRAFQIPRLIREIARRRGRENEERFLSSFTEEELKRENLPVWFVRLRRSTPEEDRRGVDAIMETDVGGVLFQIKSSEGGVAIFQRKHPKTHIICVVVRPEQSCAELRKEAFILATNKRDELLKLRGVA